jgi:hypothetical protein
MTILRAAFCPHPPLLVPDVGAGEPVAVRTPALDAIRWLIEPPVQEIIVLGAGSEPAIFPPGSVGSFAGYGVGVRTHLPGSPESGTAPSRTAGSTTAALMPLPLAVAGWLLDAAGWSGTAIGVTCGPSGELGGEALNDRPAGLLVMGDGSARRTEKAPGWLDERAAGFDAGISAALAAGDPQQLRTDLALAAQLLAAGAPAWVAAADLLAGQAWAAEVSYDGAPYGVGYFVARWMRLPTPLHEPGG